MSNTVKNIENSLKHSYSYQEFQDLVEKLLVEGKSTTEGASEDFVHYSKLGLQRMQRWDKRFTLTLKQRETLQESVNKKQTWVVLSEGWCGDAAHSVPVINKLAEASDHIDLRIVLREKNLELMNNFLTNGGKSIPKLIIFDPASKEVIADWGPRPKAAQDIFLNARKNNIDFEVYEQDLQKWYNKDKGQTATNEILDLLK